MTISHYLVTDSERMVLATSLLSPLSINDGLTMTEQAHYNTLADVTSAVDSGTAVHWKNDGYTVTRDKHGEYFILCSTGNAVGLFWLDGVTSDYKPSDFYTLRQRQ